MDELHENVSGVCSRLEVLDSILVVVEGRMLHKAMISLVTQLLSRGRHGVYVSINKPHDTVEDELRGEGLDVDRIFFIDCLTKAVGRGVKSKENVYYARNPSDLDHEGGILQVIGERLHSIPGGKFIIVDALRTLLIHNEPSVVSRFMKRLGGYAKSHDVKVVVLTRLEHDTSLVERISRTLDDIVYI
jgi:hypothetical protein